MRQPFQRAADAAQPRTQAAAEDLPQWDLGDLYSGEDAPELARDLEWLKGAHAEFAADYEGRIAALDAAGLLECIRRYEAMQETGGRVMAFASLRHAQLATDPERSSFLSNCQEKLTEYSSPLVFLELEINAVEEDALHRMYGESAELARYAPLLRRMRAMKPHQLSQELERFIHDLGAVEDAWCRLYDETFAALKFSVDDAELGLEETLNLLTDPERGRREAAARELARVFAQNTATVARVHNTSAKEKEIVDRWRKLPAPQTARHLHDDVETEVVEALRDAVVAAYPRLSHRYYELKRRWMGLDRMQVWDRNAPLPLDDSALVGWTEAKDIVLDAYGAFDARLADLARPFFDKGWIDAGPRPGKSPGAFCHPTVAGLHPYVLMNYMGKPRDVMTLAHELGHGVHQSLAAGQGQLLSHTPLTLAETASVFGEMLTFRSMLGRAESAKERKSLLAGKVEDMINTVVRQIAFYDFECKLHAERRKGELTPEGIGALWMSVQAESLGPAFDFMDGYETFWTYIPHFVHVPFYVYAYAFGDGMVNALYAVYEENPEGFQDLYIDMLAAGGTKRHGELLAPFGLDAADPSFWDRGLSMIARLIDELEEMEDAPG